MLWAYGNFWIAELLLVLNFLNLVALYLRYPTTPRLIHIPVVSGPLAWTFVAIFWNGAAMVGAHHTPARILANIVVWAILVFGFLFLVAFKDYYIGFELSILSACKLYTTLPPPPLPGFSCSPLEYEANSSRTKNHSSRSSPVWNSNHCTPVDLRLCHHGRPLPNNSHLRRPRGFRRQRPQEPRRCG